MNQNLEDLAKNPFSDVPVPQKLEYRYGHKSTLTQLSVQQAEKYIPVSEDQYGGTAKYFTREPDPNNPKWDIIVYYTNRSTRAVDVPDGYSLEDATWVYVLSNPSMPGMVKIGMTDRNLGERKKELDRHSGVPTPFVIEYGFPCINAGRLEKEIHIYLESQGVRANSDREFFYLSPETAIEVVDKLGKPYKINLKQEENESDT